MCGKCLNFSCLRAPDIWLEEWMGVYMLPCKEHGISEWLCQKRGVSRKVQYHRMSCLSTSWWVVWSHSWPFLISLAVPNLNLKAQGLGSCASQNACLLSGPKHVLSIRDGTSAPAYPQLALCVSSSWWGSSSAPYLALTSASPEKPGCVVCGIFVSATTEGVARARGRECM